MRVRCNLCRSRVQDTFAAKWKHILRKHPEEMFSRLLPMAFDPSIAREVGAQIGRTLREQLGRRCMNG